MDTAKLKSFVNKFWDDSALPALAELVKIPCKHRLFDPHWQENGYLKQAANLVGNWIAKQNIPNTKVEVLQLENLSPLLFVEIMGEKSEKTILFYGHLDKMPEGTGWSEGLGPWTPVIKDNRLYGRGACDDGPASFIATTAIKALHEQSIPYARCVYIFEAAEEGGGGDVDVYLDHLKGRIGTPDLIIALDDGGNDAERLWSITSLRGHIVGSLKVECYQEATHSGTGSGMYPSTFRIARQLLSRIEDEKTGEILLPSARYQLPKERIAEINEFVKLSDGSILEAVKTLPGCKPVSTDLVEAVIGGTWNAALSIIGVDGIPSISDSANVLRPATILRLALRTPPTADAKKIAAELKQTLESDPPYGAKVSYAVANIYSGWNAAPRARWLGQVLEESSKTYFGNSFACKGTGGSIGIIATFAELYPKAQIVSMGPLVAGSNIHSANEFLDIPLTKKITCCVAEVIAKQASENN